MARTKQPRAAARSATQTKPKSPVKPLFKVEKICARKVKSRQKQLLIKWVGYDEEESTWEPEENIKVDIPVMYKRFIGEYGSERVQDDDDEEA